MPFATHPGRLLKRELKARELSANRLALDSLRDRICLRRIGVGFGRGG